MKATKPVNIPVLMYHAITATGVKAANAVHISIDQFFEQMHWLHSEGYEPVSLHTFTELMTGREKTPQKPVLITFDDGYYSQLHKATPVLKQFNFTATLFLTADAAGQYSYKNIFPNDTDCPADDRPLTWPELREMENGLWEIEAHGCHHQRHAALTEKQIVHELHQSKSIIENELQKQVGFYAYPYGSYKTFVLHELMRQGYSAAFAVHPGMAKRTQDARRYHRIEINQNDTLSSFILKTTKGYISGRQKLISAFRDGIFRSSRIKDVIMMLSGNRIN